MDWTSIIFGAFLGLVLLPVVYDIGLYLVMRKEFLIWHGLRAIAVTFMALSAMKVALPGAMDSESVRRIIQILATDFSVAVSGAFLVAYVEKGMISRRLSLALRATLPLTVIMTMLLLGFGENPVVAYLRNGHFLTVLILLIAGLTQALRRGSRAARFQATAWSGVFGVCAVALYYELVLLHGMPNWMEAILFAIALEIVVTAAGVADRFMILKRERDDAMSREREARNASITDPLTGLRNRRGLATRFSSTDRDEVKAIAIIDIDHFKRINDTFGHDVGDEVLVAVAQAIEGPTRFAARLGGEEFAVLSFAEDWQADIEQAREAIFTSVSRGVSSIRFAVTASAGGVSAEASRDFATLMKIADRALYRAKAEGRDRLVIETRQGLDSRDFESAESLAA